MLIYVPGTAFVILQFVVAKARLVSVLFSGPGLLNTWNVLRAESSRGFLCSVNAVTFDGGWLPAEAAT